MQSVLVRHGLGFVTVGWLLARRAKSPLSRNRVFVVFEGQERTYRQVWDDAVRTARWFDAERCQRVADGRLEEGEPLRVGIYQDNNLAFVSAYFGAALSGSVLFGLNTGLRGPTLVTLIERADLALILATDATLPELERVAGELGDVEVVRTDTAEAGGLEAAIQAAEAAEGGPFDAPPRVSVNSLDPLVVIYTSGTTGAPKGVVCPHILLVGVGLVTSRRVRLTKRDRGYVCMPMFHSNAWFLGVMPMLFVGGSFVLKRRFSASAFERDLLADGPTYMNYVGQPIHYILGALEAQHGGGEAVVAALASDPRNRFRVAHGNGATPQDRDKLVRYLGMDHVYELYGSTEAAISTVVKPGDPSDSVGAAGRKVRILDEQDQECPPGQVDEHGRLTNYDQAVGEIVARVPQGNVFFQGYHGNQDATESKYRGGWFRSGDLGHIRVIGGRRYLYFDGRTDDWIRKDGENFSAENVGRFAGEHDDVALAVAYGVPHPLADEAVMIAVQLADGAVFDGQATHDRFTQQCETGGMDPKWLPDFIRVVVDFETTPTQKVLVRPLKRRHFLAGDPVWFRTRGDTTYRPFTAQDLDALRAQFEGNGRGALLER